MSLISYAPRSEPPAVDPALADAARTLVEMTRHAQGLPPQITDVAVLDHVAVIVRGATPLPGGDGAG